MAKKDKSRSNTSRLSKKQKSNVKIGASSLIIKLVSRSNKSEEVNPDLTPRNLESALSQFAKADGFPEGVLIPDYSGFKEWIHTQLSESAENSFVFNRLHKNNTGHYAASVNLLEEMRIRMERFKSLLKTDFDNDIDRNVTYNKYKLLISVLSGDPRGRDFSQALDKFSNEEQKQEVDLDLCSQAELRLRFFDSLERGNWRQAFLLLGKLKKLEHDPGELAYLTSLAYFQSEGFSDSIIYASQVKSDHVDYLGASALWLESTAYLGDIKGFFRQLKIVGINKISPLYLRYLLQIIMVNAIDPTKITNEIGTEMGGDRLEMADVDVEQDPFLPAFNRYSCEIAVRVVEHIGIADLEYSLSSDNTEFNDENEKEIPTEFLRLGLPLCLYDRLLWDEILDAESHERFIPIVKRLLNVPYPVTLNDHIQALKVQLRLGATLPFINNTARMLETLTGRDFDKKPFIDIVQAAYIQATVLSSDLEPIFKNFLESIQGNNFLTGTHKADIERLKLLSTLSPMGRQSYEWAEAAFYAADESSSGTIRDAGMISLGFFRIFELELNSRMLLPLRNDPKASDLLSAQWILVSKQLEDLKIISTKNKIKLIDKCITFWSRLIPELKKVLSEESSGLELGSLECLLSKTMSIEGPDHEIKTFLANLLSQRLTQSGLVAYQSGALVGLISREVRERFRNPPAHTRFLPLRVARECKVHVDFGLQSLSKWLI
jgi:hypothetical protein